MSEVRILIADDHELLRQGLVAHVGRRPGWRVVGEGRNGQEAVMQAAALQPDLIVLDVSMPEIDGLTAARRILEHTPDARILILTAYESERLMIEVRATGARGYVLKSDAGTVLIKALEALLAGDTFFSGAPPAALRYGPADSPERAPPFSARELQIVRLLASGHSNKDVARALDISVKTAETHRSNIMRKSACDSLAELVRHAIRHGFIEP